jgi:hypothetical protein
MAEILQFNGVTFLPESPKAMLQKAKKWDMKRCVVIGFDANGEMVFGGSFAEAGDILMLLELARQFVVNNHFGRSV